jgi:predicted ArsR family transcriptional regulator
VDRDGTGAGVGPTRIGAGVGPTGAGGGADRDGTGADLAGLAGLAEPTRRALYLYVLDQGSAVSRDDAATGVGIPRHKAKFHLDKLVDDGLLEVEFARRTGRQGPGAGRPAKLYRCAAREFSVTLPQRSYELAGRLMARAIAGARGAGRPVAETLDEAAREQGRGLAAEALRRAGEDPSQAVLLAAVRSVLDEQGYVTRAEPSGLAFANCPFHALVAEHTDLVCGMNLAIAEGMLGGLPPLPVGAVLDPGEGRCCVRLAAAGRADP